MKIDNLLQIIKEEVKKSGLCDTLVLFGSAIYDDNPRDIDILLYREKDIRPIGFMDYIKFIDYMDNKYKNIGFAFSSGKPKEKKYEVEVAFLPYFPFMKEKEKGFVKDLYKNHRVLFGNDPFLEYVDTTAADLLGFINLLHENNVNSNYFKIKVLLREGMNYKGYNLEKKSLVPKFEKTYNFNLSNDFKNAMLGRKVEDKKLAKEYEDIWLRIKQEIFSENPNLFNKELGYPKKYLLMIEVYRELRILWEKESLGTIKSYLIKKDKEFGLLG